MWLWTAADGLQAGNPDEFTRVIHNSSAFGSGQRMTLWTSRIFVIALSKVTPRAESFSAGARVGPGARRPGHEPRIFRAWRRRPGEPSMMRPGCAGAVCPREGSEALHKSPTGATGLSTAMTRLVPRFSPLEVKKRSDHGQNREEFRALRPCPHSASGTSPRPGPGAKRQVGRLTLSTENVEPVEAPAEALGGARDTGPLRAPGRAVGALGP